MSEIEELCALLDMRGAEWAIDMGGIVAWVGANERLCHAYARSDQLTVDVEMFSITPAQAVEATLGRGTCNLPETRIDHGSIEYNGTTEWRRCSECGEEVMAYPARFCPNCGREVE